MGHIKILPDTLISQIAAGEVVERPASAVKELLENALDAGATHIGIESEQGGTRLIAVRDNGSGMEKEDIMLAFSRHATSKIASLEDLENINSFGFRGEALAAISSCAQVTLRTRTKNSQNGYELSVNGGKIGQLQTVGCQPGTEVIIRNLFFNTPARKKFLKSENTEFSHIAAIVSHMALANPQVGFELKHNGKTLIQVPQNSNEAARATQLLGKNFVGESLPVFFKTESIHIYGLIGRPGQALSTKRHQYLFVNGRDVSDPLISRAVTDAYGSRLPGRVWPAFVLHIDMAPHEVDVNVHPRKLAVKFLEPRRIYRDTRQAVEQGLMEEITNYGITELRNNEEIMKLRNYEIEKKRDQMQNAMEFGTQFVGQERRAEGLVSGEADGANGGLGDFHSGILLGQIANSYLLVFSEEGLAIIDQHAAHERIMYEKLKARENAKTPEVQPLLAPFTLDLSPEEAVFMQSVAAHLEGLGFEFDAWSGSTIVIRACPPQLQAENMQKIFRDFLRDTAEENLKEKILPERILKSLACKAAVKFGMKLSPEEQTNLLREIEKTPNSSTCPHGRPTKVLVSFDELERRFYRRK